jgi:hypothetical protein
LQTFYIVDPQSYQLDTSPTPQLIRSGLWQWVQSPGLERFQLLTAPDQWILRGTILTLMEHGPAEAHYEIVCDSGWHTRSAEISLNDGYSERWLRIRTVDGEWYTNEQLSEAVSGCVDIDLGWSPSTNTLPIRRLQLDIGQSSGAVIAAWVRFPDLILEPLPQEYLRVSDQQYRYSSRGGAFVAQISVDDAGLPLDYEGIWRRVGPR